MSNGLYYAYRNGVQGAHATRIVLSTDTIVAALIDHSLATPDVTTHAFYSSIAAGQVGDLSDPFTGKSLGVLNVGVFDSDDLLLTAVSGNSVESLNILKDTGNPATSDMISYFDNTSGLPLTPNGGDVLVTWSGSGIWQV